MRLLERGGADLLGGAVGCAQCGATSRLGRHHGTDGAAGLGVDAAAARRARRAPSHDPDANPRLAELALRMQTFVEIAGSGGRLASATTGKCWTRLARNWPSCAVASARCSAQFAQRSDAVLRAAAAKNALQDAVITMRNGRYVIPVKQEHRSTVPGIVHDTSASGATVFVEPMPVVELNNEISSAQAEEEREVQRILRELSQRVGDVSESLLSTIDALVQLDVIFAKARSARQMNAERPVMNDGGWININVVADPLLTGTAGPIDVWVGRDFRWTCHHRPEYRWQDGDAETIGLFCLMAQAGLSVPAGVGTELNVFTGIFADIGDEQSIEQNLSTFSSHMANIVDILASMDSRSLVLFDELGAGTDPAEGAVLAMAILEHVQHVAAVVAATTHYSELKAFVHERPGMENASMEFDAETLAPTYRLLMGMPGRSNALEIAARFGLPEHILARARGRLSRHDDVKVEDLIRDLEAATKAAEEERREAAKLRAEAERLQEELADIACRWQRTRRELEEQAQLEAREIVRSAQREAEEIDRVAASASKMKSASNKLGPAAADSLGGAGARCRPA